jgi:environmental stress-induced protein Ves
MDIGHEAVGNEGPLLLREVGYRRERWRNGAGWTREVHAHPSARDDGWDWRLSIAEIDADAPFSAFPGVERELVLLEGNGLRLRFDDGQVAELLPPHDRLRFAGERALRGELLDGPTRDFNLMWRRDAVDAQLWHRPLVGSMLLFADPGSTWAIHVLAGRAQLAAGTLSAEMPSCELGWGDTALLPGGAERRRYPIEGGGELLVIRITPAASSSSPAG